jgi:signal transduction histidine kinase
MTASLQLRLYAAAAIKPASRHTSSFPARTSSTQLRRAFSVLKKQAMLSTELTEAQVSALRANRDRLAQDLHHTCQWGYGIRWGE